MTTEKKAPRDSNGKAERPAGEPLVDGSPRTFRRHDPQEPKRPRAEPTPDLFDDPPFPDLAALVYDLARADDSDEHRAELRRRHGILESTTDDALRSAAEVVQIVAFSLANNPDASKLISKLREAARGHYRSRCLLLDRLRRARHQLARLDEQGRDEAAILDWLATEVRSWARIEPELSQVNERNLLRSLRCTAEGAAGDAEQGFPRLAAQVTVSVNAFGDTDEASAVAAFRRQNSRTA